MKQIVFPVLEQAWLPLETYEQETRVQWVLTTCNEALISLTDTIFPKYFHNLKSVSDCFVDLLVANCKDSHESSRKISVDALKRFGFVAIQNGATDLLPHLIDAFKQLFNNATPQVLLQQPKVDLEILEQDYLDELSGRKQKNLTFSSEACEVQCLVQLWLIGAVSELEENISDPTIIQPWLECLENSYLFAKDFNKNVLLRYKLWKDGFMGALKMLPGLLKQERESLATLVQFMEKQSGVQEKLYTITECVLERYVLAQENYRYPQDNLALIAKREDTDQSVSTRASSSENDSTLTKELVDLLKDEAERHLQSMTPVIANILLPALNSAQDAGYKLPKMAVLAQIIECDSYEIRRQVAKIVSKLL